MADPSAALRPRSVAELRHDLRTPLNHIIGYGEMLMEDAEERSDTASVDALRQIHSTAKELVGIIQTILLPHKTEVTDGELAALRDRLYAPLQGIIVSARRLLERGGPSTAKDLETIRSAAERLQSMAGEAATAVAPAADKGAAPAASE